jgi:hypothetical protein
VVALLVWRAWSDRDVGGKLALTLAAGAGVPPIVAAIAGTPILAARNLTPALLMLLLAFAVELAVLARRREWGLGIALVAAAGLAWSLAATTAVDGLQRPDWRGTADRLGPPPSGGRLLVVPSDASEPLLYYLPSSEEVAEAPPGAGTAIVVSGVDDMKRIPPSDVASARDSLGGDAEILFEPASG